MIESLLLCATRVATFYGKRSLTNASGFFFARDERLFVVTSLHVMVDESGRHFPDRIEVELHTDSDNMVDTVWFSIPLYRGGRSVWRQATDGAGRVDVAVIELERDALPETAVYHAFTPQHLLGDDDYVEIGSSLLLLGFPLGFHDTLHHLPVARHAGLASSFGLRFQGLGYFLTDARMHRGTSGAPVVMRIPQPSDAQKDLPWMLLGIHSARLDMGARDLLQDEALGLNCAWYADILMTLTERKESAPAPATVPTTAQIPAPAQIQAPAPLPAMTLVQKQSSSKDP